MPDAILADPAPAAPPALTPLVLPPAQFTNPADSFKPFPLTVGVTVDGRSYSMVGIRRFTVAQMRAISENFRANAEANPDARPAMPIYTDDTGQDLPPAVLDALTPDDFDALDKATLDFLPARMRPTAPETTSDASPPEAGKSTEQ